MQIGCKSHRPRVNLGSNCEPACGTVGLPASPGEYSPPFSIWHVGLMVLGWDGMGLQGIGDARFHDVRSGFYGFAFISQ